MSDENSAPPAGLFGWTPAPPRGPGRPALEWTPEKSREIMGMLSANHLVKTIAQVIGCDVKTLRKVFPRELATRGHAHLVVRAKLLGQALAEAEKGNVAAIKLADRLIDAERSRTLAHTITTRQSGAGQSTAVNPPKATHLGKKEAKRASAAAIEGLYAPRTLADLKRLPN